MLSQELTGDLNINNSEGKKVCCIEHDGAKLQIKDEQDRVLQELPNNNQ